MTLTPRGVAFGIVVLAVSLALGSAASAQTINRCQASKKKCVIKKVNGLLRCHVKAEGKGTAVDPACLQRSMDKFSDGATGCWDKLEARGGCLTTGDAGTMEAKIDAFVLDVVEELDPGYPAPVQNTCSAGKKKCVIKKVAGLLNCHAKANKQGVLDPACIQKQKDKFDGGAKGPAKACFTKLEARGNCLTTGDLATLEAKIDAFVDDVVCELDAAGGTCTTACPSTLEFTASATASESELDSGWYGFAHDLPFIADATLTVAVTGCANAIPPCGVCTFAGPIPNANAGAGAIDSRRCSNDTSITCTSDAVCAASHCVGGTNDGAACTVHSECPGSSCSGPGICGYFWGSNLPLSAGGISMCLRNEIQGPVSGTADIEGGAISRDLSLRTRAYVGITIDAPCPVCSGDGTANDGVPGGACSSGDRSGLACDANGTSPLFGPTSLDCPPFAQADTTSFSPAPSHLVSSTGSQSLTLSAASPACTAGGFGGLRCACDTCNSGTSPLPCATNADCPDPPGPAGPICGGKRCLGGTNAGTPCAAFSECPGGSSCGRAGWPTQPNSCNDATCTSLGGNEGTCAAGPLDNVCAAPEQYRACTPATQTTDCPLTHTCTTQNRPCFLDNGVIGGSIAVAGATDAPVDAFSRPTLGTVYCAPPTSSAFANVGLGGLPGPARLRLRETVKAIP